MTTAEQYITHVQNAFAKAERGESKLPQEILDMEGMTGTKTRYFYNNLLELDGARYLEIGVWKGSSTCSAMYDNIAHVVAMDNFSSFGGPKQDFLDNFAKYKGANDAKFIEHDCFTFDVSRFVSSFNIFLADSDHSEDSQRRIIEDYLPAMDNTFILLIDDWNWPEVRKGTQDAIDKHGLKVLWSHIIRTTDDDTFPVNNQVASEGYWNGIAAFVIQKP